MSLDNPSVREILPIFIQKLYNDNKLLIWTLTGIVLFVGLPGVLFLIAPYVSESPYHKCSISFRISLGGELTGIPLHKGCWMWNFFDLEIAILVISTKVILLGCLLAGGCILALRAHEYWVESKSHVISKNEYKNKDSKEE